MATRIGVSCITVLEPAAQIMGLGSSETMLMYNFKRLDAMEQVKAGRRKTTIDRAWGDCCDRRCYVFSF